MNLIASNKVEKIVTSIFTELAQKKQEAINKGIDVIDLSVGSPDIPPPSYVVDTLVKYSQDTTKYGYTLKGIDEFNEAGYILLQKKIHVDLNQLGRSAAIDGLSGWTFPFGHRYY